MASQRMSSHVVEETEAQGSSHREAMSHPKAQFAQPEINVVTHLPTVVALQETQQQILEQLASIKTN